MRMRVGRRGAARVAWPVAGSLLLMGLLGRHMDQEIRLSPDSGMYHFLALNILRGKGYYDVPVGRVEDYPPETIWRFPREMDTLRQSGPGFPPRKAMTRGPVYPLMLAAIYGIHGEDPDAVIPYHLALVGLLGASLVGLGWSLWGVPGAVAGLVAVFLYGHFPDARYPPVMMMTELTAATLLTISALAASWARKGPSRREVVVAIALTLAILCRPALLFVGILYGLALLAAGSRAGLRRAALFGTPCALILGGWSAYASVEAGRFVPIADNGRLNMVAGLDPEKAARLSGRPAPELTEESLERFWRTFGSYEAPPGTTWSVIGRALPRWRDVARLLYLKLKIGLFWLPRSLLAFSLVGFALACAMRGRQALPTTQGTEAEGAETTLRLLPVGLLQRRTLIESGAWALALGTGLVALGYSHPGLMLAFLAAPPVALLARVEAVRVGGKESDAPEPSGGRTRDGADAPGWLLAWCYGYILMTLLTTGVRRFSRPYLPIFYLFAVMSVPLLATALLAFRDATLRFGRVWRFAWGEGPRDKRDPRPEDRSR